MKAAKSGEEIEREGRGREGERGVENEGRERERKERGEEMPISHDQTKPREKKINANEAENASGNSSLLRSVKNLSGMRIGSVLYLTKESQLRCR